MSNMGETNKPIHREDLSSLVLLSTKNKSYVRVKCKQAFIQSFFASEASPPTPLTFFFTQISINCVTKSSCYVGLIRLSFYECSMTISNWSLITI